MGRESRRAGNIAARGHSEGSPYGTVCISLHWQRTCSGEKWERECRGAEGEKMSW